MQIVLGWCARVLIPTAVSESGVWGAEGSESRASYPLRGPERPFTHIVRGE